MNRMIRVVHILIAALSSTVCLLVASCGGGSRQRLALEELERQNRADSLMTNDSLALSLADWFDGHGTANEQVRAHYILGRTYADLGEAPQAIQSYQDAVDRADTTASDCDYYTLCRVYAQMSGILYDLSLLDEYLKYSDRSVAYALKAKDSLVAFNEQVLKVRAYNDLEHYDSVVTIFEHVFKQLLEKKDTLRAACNSVLPVDALLSLGQLDKAKYYLSFYENNSGYFCKDGSIEQGREVYYYYKGKYYLAIGKPDSADYYFRKELTTGKDFNNQNAAAYGLAQTYLYKNTPDSLGKYALYAYIMNDSTYKEYATESVARTLALHNYSRHERLARRESERADFEQRRFLVFAYLMVVVIIAIICIAVIIYAASHRRRRKAVLRYRLKSEQLKCALEKLSQMKCQKTVSAQNLAEKEQDIQRLQLEIDQLLQYRHLIQDTVNLRIEESGIGQLLKENTAKGSKLTESEWLMVEGFVEKELPEFSKFIKMNKNLMGINKSRICILLRLHVGNKSAANMIGVTPAYVSKASGEILSDFFQSEGGGKRLAVVLKGLA